VGLPLHFRKIVGKHFQGNWPVGNFGQNVPRKAFIIRNPRFAHKRRVGGETFDQRIAVQGQNLVPIRPVGEQLDLPLCEGFHDQHTILGYAAPNIRLRDKIAHYANNQNHQTILQSDRNLAQRHNELNAFHMLSL
jgi:hypothetical protein